MISRIPVFVGTPSETFTPTQSGAVATIFWKCCLEAQREGIEPAVVARRSPAQPYPWERLLLVDTPVPSSGLGLKLARLERRVFGWTALGHRAHAAGVLRGLREAGLTSSPILICNDPELLVFLRKHLPRARLLHWFQNQLPCKAPAKHLFAKAADSVIAVSDFTARWCEGYYGLAARSVKTVYNAVDSEEFVPAAEAPGGPPVINFVGRTGIEKAPDLVLRACLQLAAHTRSFQVQLLGSNHWDRFELDDYQRELQGLVRELEELGIPVRRPGHISRQNLPRELQQAAVHVVPSRWDEPFGLVTLEGMASGLATIASRTGGTPEVVGSGGMLFERDSVEELADGLKRLVLDEDARRELQLLGRERAETFTWRRTWSGLRDQLLN